MIGTPFVTKDEIHNRKIANIDKKPWEQVGINDEGQKRFHGAFTGGFSAGYWNTVGSKEGWTPSTFVSSRTTTEGLQPTKKQTIYDFMDDEDIGELQVGETITAKGEFDTLGTLEREEMRKQWEVNKGGNEYTPGQNMDILGGVLDDFITTSNDSIGYKLLTTMGWNLRLDYDFTKREGEAESHSDKKRKLKEENQDGMKNIFENPIKYKDNCYGLGYEGEHLNSIDSSQTSNFDKLSRFELDPNTRMLKDQREKSSNRISMDGFMNEDNIDVYTSKHKQVAKSGIEDYNLDVVDLDDISVSKGKNILRGEKQIGEENVKFIFGNTLQIKKIDVQLEDVPKDFNPKGVVLHRWKGQLGPEPTLKAKEMGRMNSEKRGFLLGEIPLLNSNSKEDCKFEKYSNEEIDRIVGRHNKFVAHKEQELRTSDIVINLPFADDESQVNRFRAYICERKGLKVGGETGSQLMRASEIEKEKKLFNSLYQKNENRKNVLQSSNITSQMIESLDHKPKNYLEDELKDESKTQAEKDEILKRIEKIQGELNKRKVIPWRPNYMLCRRLGIKDPYEGRPMPKVIKEIKRRTFVKGETIGSSSRRTGIINDGNLFFQEIEAEIKEFESAQRSGVVDKEKEEEEEEEEEGEGEEEKGENINIPSLINLESRPPMSFFKSIFGDDQTENKQTNLQLQDDNELDNDDDFI